jgi:hypothetical protein
MGTSILDAGSQTEECRMSNPTGLRFAGAGVVLAVLAAPVTRAADWPVLDADALRMTAEPKAPSAPAIYLYRQVDRDDQDGDEINTLAVKILTEEGRDRANVQIAYDRSREGISGIEARTIHPDGTIVKFDGKVYDSTIVKSRDVRIMTKTFTFPDVRVGSIIEYRYRRNMAARYVYDSQWLLEDDLFTKHGVFTLRANERFPIMWSWPVGLPPGAAPPVRSGQRIKMELQDVPAFVTEEYMPPESALKLRVEFDYQEAMPEKDADKFWKRFAKERFGIVDDFIDHRRAMEKALAQIIDPADAPEVRLQKIYDRVQHLRNVDYQPERSVEEKEREKISHSDDATDVWNRGYGNRYQITWLFLALARVAGLQADPVEVSTRDRYFFDRDMKNASALNNNVVRIRLGEREIYADPGIPHAPLGVLPWFESGVTGLVLAKDGGAWIKTPLPSEKDSRLERNATFALSVGGSLEGHLVVTYTGLQALTRRLAVRNDDDRARKEWLEDEVKRYVPTGIDVKMTNVPDWGASSNTLRAEFDIHVPGFAESAGSRLLLALSVFRAEEGQMFTHAERRHPIYFKYPFAHDDTVVINLPSGYEPTGLPDPYTRDAGSVHYRNIVDFHDGKLTERRHVDVVGVLYPVKAYAPLHEFFQGVRAGDEEQVVLSRAKKNAAQ